jgi:hypothetical protein
MAASWPTQSDDVPFAASLNGLPKYVASTTLSEPLEWRNSTLLQGDVAKAVAELKEQPGKNLVAWCDTRVPDELLRRRLEAVEGLAGLLAT